MTDDQQELPLPPVPGPLALRPGDVVERGQHGVLNPSPFSIRMPAETGTVVDVITGEAGLVQTVFIVVEGTAGLVVDLHVTSEAHGVQNRWRRA